MSLAQLQAAVTRLVGAVKAIRGQVKALAVAEQLRTKRAVVNLSPLAIGTQDVEISWPIPFADDTYWVGVELVTGAAGIGTTHAQLKPATRTADGCTITVVADAVVAVAFLDVVAIKT